MGGNRRQPPKPPAQPPVASKAKDYSMDRPSEVQNELDDLRNRGLAKVLNRHFTDTTKQLAKEKAAADAALADLERRRAQTSTFVASKGGELNPFDSMYVNLQQKRAECRRKERETMLLYQRYVHKYGKNNDNNAPGSTSSGIMATPPNAAALAASELSPATSSASTPEVPPPPSPVPSARATTTTLQPLDENSEAEGTVDSDVNFSKFYNKRIQEKQQTSTTAVDPPTKSLEAPERLIEALTPPRLSTSGRESSNDPPEEDTPRTAESDDENDVVKNQVKTEDDLNYMKADPPADPPAVKYAKDSVTKSTPIAHNRETPPTEEEEEKEKLGWRKALFADDEPKEENDESAAADDSAAVESTTPVETIIKEATERLEILSDTSDSNRPTREVLTEVPSAAEMTEEDEDDRSIISGLTISSQVTKQVMDEIANEMKRFLNTETEAIRKMLDEEEEKTLESTILNGSSSLLGDETKRASMKAEAMAREMQKILDAYANEDPSESNFDADETEGDTDTIGDTVATAGYPKKYETSDPTKNWMVYYDEKFQREYYFEKNSKTTQWEPPGASKSESRIFSEDVSPSSFKRTRSRRDLYRKKIRKRRIRRFAAFSVFVLGAGATVYHWQTNHPDKTYQEAMAASLHSTSERIVDAVDISLYTLADGMEFVKDQIEYTFTDRKAREEEQKARQHEEMEMKRKAKELAEKERARVEAERKAAEARRLQEEKERAEAEAEKTREESNRRELELLEAKRKAEAEDAQRRKTQVEARRNVGEESKALQRHWACFLPLAYVHPRCNKLAKLRRFYKENDALNAFLK